MPGTRVVGCVVPPLGTRCRARRTIFRPLLSASRTNPLSSPSFSGTRCGKKKARMKKVLDRVGETEKKTVFEGVGWGEKKAASKFFIRPAETSFKPRRSTVTLGFVALRYGRSNWAERASYLQSSYENKGGAEGKGEGKGGGGKDRSARYRVTCARMCGFRAMFRQAVWKKAKLDHGRIGPRIKSKSFFSRSFVCSNFKDYYR